MKNLRFVLNLIAALLFVPLAIKHPGIAALLVITCAGAFFPSEMILRETRLGLNTITLSGLTELLFKSRDIVSRELTGAISAVMVNAGSEGVSLGGTVTSMKTAQPTLNSTYTPAMTIPGGDDQTLTAETMTIGQVANVKIPLTGETTLQLINTIGFEAAMTQLMTQAMRTCVNAIESHVCTVAYKGASRATGTAGTTPFASTIAILADLRQILVDNGMTEPEKDGQCTAVINTAAGTKLRQITNLYKANEAGTDATLRRGELLNLMGLSIKESAGIASHTKGAGTGYDIVTAGEAIGQTTLSFEGGTVNATGIKAGDVLAFDTDTANKYVVRTGSTATSGDIVLNDPGLRVAAVDASEATIGNSYTANFACHKSAIELVMRPPAMPPNLTGGKGDAAVARITLFDPKTGLVFEAAVYLGYGMNMVDITTFYQAKVWKPDFVAALLG
jgi:hypothetical protein